MTTLVRRFTLATALVLVCAGVAQTQEGGSGTITFSSYNSNPLPRAFEEARVAEWNATHPDQPVAYSVINQEDFKQAIRAYLVANPPPDVLTWFGGERARFFIDRGLIADLSDLWAEHNFDEVYAPAFNALARGADGKPYFLPTFYYWWAIYYRPSLFVQAGIEQPPETWDELLEACDRLNAAGITPFTIGARFRWPAAAWFDYINMRLNGPAFHNRLMQMQESYTDLRVREVFYYWGQLFDHDCFIDDPAALDWQEAVDDMVRGRAAMYLMGQFMQDSYPDEAEADLDFFRFPVINPNAPIGEDAPTNGYFMAAGAANRQGGEDLLAFLGSREYQQRALEALGRLPTRLDVDTSSAPPLTRKGIALIQSADYVAQFYDRDTSPPMAEAGMDAFMRFWDDPASMGDILQNLEAERQRILEEETGETP